MTIQYGLIAMELIEHINASASPGVEVTAETDLTQTGVLDSLRLLDLIAHVESTYGIRVHENEISHQHFRSVDCLTRLVVSKLLSPLKADCLLCRELHSMKALSVFDTPSPVCSPHAPIAPPAHRDPPQHL